MNKLWILIGLPGVGKSTWVKNHLDSFQNEVYIRPIIASSDDYIENFAKINCKTYNEVFSSVIKDAQHECEREAAYGASKGLDVIWDQTNLSKKTRKKRLDMFSSTYEKIAVLVSCSDVNEWERRLDSRPGKNIPRNILDSMAKQLEYPSYDEGFNSIIEYTN